MTVICKSLFKKETNIEIFSNLDVNLSTGDVGKIEGSFGQSGKIKIRIPGSVLFTYIINHGKGKLF
jgi:selenocysteine-specific elongation factor